jgi:hypothetical protein
MTACNTMTVGSPPYGPNGGDLNGFVPFVAANAWNTNIANAPIDPNSAALTAVWAAAGGYKLHATFGSSPDNGGIPYIVVDSSETPSVPIHVIDYVKDSDVTVAPYPSGDAVPIEGDPTDCAGWPDTYLSDTHTLVVDRHTCWLYETFETNRCNGLYDSASETIFDMTANANQSLDFRRCRRIIDLRRAGALRRGSFRSDQSRIPLYDGTHGGRLPWRIFCAASQSCSEQK